MTKIKMNAWQIVNSWRESRSPVVVERALRAFLAMGPLEAARCALLADSAGSNGVGRFLAEVDGYRSSPALWRRQAREKWRRRQADIAQEASLARWTGMSRWLRAHR